MNYIISGNGTMTIVIDNESFSIGHDHPNYMSIKECLVNNDPEGIKALIDIPASILNYSDGDIDIKDGVLSYQEEVIHNSLTSRIMTMMRNGFPFQPMLKFLENILSNPSNRAVEELYTFLENKNLPITEDGCFLSYKALTKDYTDKWTGAIDNSIGSIIEMQRRNVDDNCNIGCGDGLHVGAIEYVEGYRCEHNEDVVVIVKVNPRDVVSVPVDSECQKVRCCRYEVVADYAGPLKSVMHKSDGGEWTTEEFAQFMNMMMTNEQAQEVEDDEDSFQDDGEYDYFNPETN